MSLRRIEESVREIMRKLGDIETRREKVLKDTRSITLNASKAIVAIHTGNMKEAKQHLSAAEEQLSELTKSTGNDLERYLVPAATEFVEAAAVMAIFQGKGIQNAERLGVSGSAYLLGLLDTIGELKRMVYDRIREDRPKEAIKIFEEMQELYNVLSPFASYDNIIKGIRRKIDVSRMLIEDTRRVVTEEIRRQKFLKEIDAATSSIRGTKVKKNL
jgi:translin